MNAPETPFRQLDEEAREIYGRLIAAAREFITQADQPYTEKYEKISRLCASSAEVLKKNPVLLKCASYATAGNYLYAHTANVTIFSQAMALELGLPPKEMSLLSFCAMAHDLGMSGFQELYLKEERLSDSEFSQITLHTEAGVDKLDRVIDLDHRIKERAKNIIYQTHERIDASGYPDRLSNEGIDILAQIIGLADVYEAMTHPRSWREALQTHEVIKQLIEMDGTGFSSKTVKALISALSIYPPGSFVALSSGEIARVLKPRKGSLTRPLVEILLDADFAPVQSRILNLFEYPLTSIERPVDMAELEEKNPKFAGGLELARWWVEW
jgi:HD-GYP domain-containing protein (c-di-GMP phosphodiesterase class II)